MTDTHPFESHRHAFLRLLPGRLDSNNVRISKLLAYEDRRLRVYYAPFDYIHSRARLAIVGVTPGPTQMVESYTVARDQLFRGHDPIEILASVKSRASFKGMRRDLARWLDDLGLASHLDLDSSAALFESAASDLVHTTSAIRYPTFRRKSDNSWANYSGTSPDMLGHRELRRMVLDVLGPELEELQRAIIIPLGKANVAIRHLCDNRRLDPARCVIGLPHPSPASPFRHRYFEAAKPELLQQVARLRVSGRTPRKAPARRVVQTRPAPAARLERRSVWSASPADSITITLTQGNINNNHVYLREHLAFFPSGAIGGTSRADGLGVLLTVHFAGSAEPVVTDIAGGNKLFFRARTPWDAFFGHHRLGAGDQVRITRLAETEYRVSPAA